MKKCRFALQPSSVKATTWPTVKQSKYRLLFNSDRQNNNIYYCLFRTSANNNNHYYYASQTEYKYNNLKRYIQALHHG